jgi:hypothetical protein
MRAEQAEWMGWLNQRTSKNRRSHCPPESNRRPDEGSRDGREHEGMTGVEQTSVVQVNMGQ